MKTLFFFLGSKIYSVRCDSHVHIDFTIESMRMYISVYSNENSNDEPFDDFAWVAYDFFVKEFRVYSPNDIRVRFLNKANQKSFVDLINKYPLEFIRINPDTLLEII